MSGISATDRQRFVNAVDAVPATHGLGVIVRRDRDLWRLRQQGGSGATVIFELRRPVISPYLKKNATPADFVTYNAKHDGGRQPGWSVRKPAGHVQPAAKALPRQANSQVASEWIALGFNCGGAVLSWIGVVGATALLPATGGSSGIAIPFAYAGALASTGQCGFSIYRTINASKGNVAANERLDKSPVYVWGMYGADGIGLLGAAGALKEMKAAHAVIRRAGPGMTTAATGRMNRVVRGELSVAFGLQAAEAGSHVVNRVVRQKLLEAVGGVVGITGSAQSGILGDLFAHDVVIWITSEKGGR